VQLYAANQRRLFAYIRVQVKSLADADDVLQQTAAVLWEKFAQFEEGTDFGRWACGVARLEVLAHHRNRARKLTFLSDNVADHLADDMLELSESVDARQEALAMCIEELKDYDQSLIKRRYQGEASIPAIAQEIGRTESTVYKSLSRIHDLLFVCIQRKQGKA
jgi:RNA polymerase sigma-70 factor (ECF subfamily)